MKPFDASAGDLLEQIIRLVWQINERPLQYVNLDYNGGIGILMVYRAAIVRNDNGRNAPDLDAGTITIGRALSIEPCELWPVIDALKAYAQEIGITQLEITNGF